MSQPCTVAAFQFLQARLNTLHFNEDGYRWAEAGGFEKPQMASHSSCALSKGQLGMVPVHRRAALKFLKSLAGTLF